MAAASLWHARRARGSHPWRSVARTYGIVAVAGALLSLGPRVYAGNVDLGPGIYRPDLVPVLAVIRVPARFSVLMAVGLSVLAGLGAQRLAAITASRAGLLLVAAVLMLLNLDLRIAPLQLSRVPSPPFVHRWLRDTVRRGGVIEYPTQGNEWAISASFYHGRRTVNGASFVWPPEMNNLAERDALSRRHLETLWEHFHPRFVLLRAGLYPPDRRASVMQRIRDHGDALLLRGQLGDEYVYELRDRGRGTVLHRRWPREALRDGRGFHLAATVEGHRPDTTNRLVAAFNDHTVLEVEPAELHHAVTRFVPLPREHIVAGSNVLTIRGEYRFTGAARRHPIGGTGIAVAADVKIVAGRSPAGVSVNGRLIEAGSGYLLVVVDPATGAVERFARFDTAEEDAASERLADFVRDVAGGSPVLVATEGAASLRLTERAVSALRALGLDEDLRARPHWGHAGIAVKGAPPGSALEAVDPRAAVLTLGDPASRTVQLSRLEFF
jgi:hypothetical protein